MSPQQNVYNDTYEKNKNDGPSEESLSEDFTKASVEKLKALAAFCRHRAANPNDESFAVLLVEASNCHVITEQSLSKLAGIDRSTANRWLNRKAIVRTPLAQTAIMNEIARMSEAAAAKLDSDAKAKKRQ